MIKGIALVARKPGMSEADFHRHWREVHGPLGLRIAALRRYVQSHRKAPPVPGFEQVPYDGLAEIWLDDLAAMDAFHTDPTYLEGARADEPNFIDMDKLQFLATTERVMFEEIEVRQDTRLTKAVFLLRRKPGMSVAEFQDYWVKGHAPQIPRDMCVLRYVQCHQLPETYARGEPPYDGVAELSFADDDAFLAYWTSPRIIEIFSADAPRFLDGARCTAFLVDEYRARW